MDYFQDQGYLIDFYTCSYVILIRSNNLYQGSVDNFNKVKSEKVVCQLKFCQAKQALKPAFRAQNSSRMMTWLHEAPEE